MFSLDGLLHVSQQGHSDPEPVCVYNASLSSSDLPGRGQSPRLTAQSAGSFWAQATPEPAFLAHSLLGRVGHTAHSGPDVLVIGRGERLHDVPKEYDSNPL